MICPSAYAPGMLGVGDHWRSPYGVVRLSVAAARPRTSTLIRPWLQHLDDYHSTGVTYGPREVGVQKLGASEAGACGPLFWNPGGQYDPVAFAPR